MRFLAFAIVSIFALWVFITHGLSGRLGFVAGVAWVAVMFSAAGFSWRWLFDLANKMEKQGGSIFKDRAGPS